MLILKNKIVNIDSKKVKLQIWDTVSLKSVSIKFFCEVL